MATLELSGTITVPGDACGGCAAAAGDTLVKAIGPDCDQGYQTVVATAKPIQIATTGVLGATFVDLDLIDTLSSIEFLFLRSSAEIIVRIDAAAARVTGSGGTFALTGAETLDLTIDGTAFTTTFLAGDDTAAEVAARINAAAALAGLATPRVIVVGGQLQIDGVLTGSAGSVAVTGGTAATLLGLSGTPSATGSGADVRVLGTYLTEFPRTTDAPARVQVSGSATISVVAAGRTSSS